jgi:hypothetical protein
MLYTNRIHYFTRNIVYNSKVNRNNFVNNKKKLNSLMNKNIIKKNFTTYSFNGGYPGVPPSEPNILFMIAASLAIYFIIKK